MKRRQEPPKPTPEGLYVLEHVNRGRVIWEPQPQIAVLWPLTKAMRSTPRTVQVLIDQAQANKERPVLDVTNAFTDLMRAGWAFVVPPHPKDQGPPPQKLPTAVTPAGEDVLLEARQAEREARKRKAAKR